MDNAERLLNDAIDRNAPAALGILVGGLGRLTRTRLLARAEPGRGLWTSLPPGQAEAIDGMIRTGDPARVNFRADQTHVEFHARVLERRRAFALNAQTQVEAVRLAWPTSLSVVQRRSAYRIGLSAAKNLRIRCWRIDADADLKAAPPADAELVVDVLDFSASGLGGVWKRRRGEAAVLSSNQRLRVDVTEPDGTTTTLDAYVRFLAGLPDPDYRRIGVQFMLCPTHIADRQKLLTLNRISGELQRAELKRLRVAR